MRLPSFSEIRNSISYLENNLHIIEKETTEEFLKRTEIPTIFRLYIIQNETSKTVNRAHVEDFLQKLKEIEKHGLDGYNQKAFRIDSLIIKIKYARFLKSRNNIVKTILNILQSNEIKETNFKILQDLLNEYELHKNESEKINELADEGLKCIKQRNYESAIEKFDEILKIDPTNYDALHHKGTILESSRRYDDAIRVFENMSKIDEKDIDPLLHIAEILTELNQSEKATTYLNKALSLEPKSTHALNIKAHNLSHLKKYDEALFVLDEILVTTTENHSGIINNKGIIYRENEKADIGLKYFTLAQELAPKDTSITKNIASTLVQMEKFDEALDIIKKIPDNSKDTQLDDLKVRIFVQLERYDDAIQIQKKHLEDNPDDSSSLEKLCVLFLLAKKIDELMKYVDKLWQVMPNDILIREGIGIQYLADRNFALAEKYFSEVLSVTPDNSSVLYNLACLKSQVNSIDEAIDYLSKSIKIDSSYKEKAREDEDFKNISDDPRFKILTE